MLCNCPLGVSRAGRSWHEQQQDCWLQKMPTQGTTKQMGESNDGYAEKNRTDLGAARTGGHSRWTPDFIFQRERRHAAARAFFRTVRDFAFAGFITFVAFAFLVAFALTAAEFFK